MPNLVSITQPSLQILGKTHTLINKNCRNFRSSNDIDMKLGTVTKPDKKNTTTLKKFYDDIVSVNYDVIVIFSFYGSLGTIWNPDFGSMVYDSYILISSSLLSCKTRKQNQKTSNTALILPL